MLWHFHLPTHPVGMKFLLTCQQCTGGPTRVSRPSSGCCWRRSGPPTCTGPPARARRPPWGGIPPAGGWPWSGGTRLPKGPIVWDPCNYVTHIFIVTCKVWWKTQGDCLNIGRNYKFGIISILIKENFLVTFCQNNIFPDYWKFLLIHTEKHHNQIATEWQQ